MSNSRVIAFDGESYLIGPGVLAPKPVCLTFDDGKSNWLLKRTEALGELKAFLRNPDIEFVGHNVAFDFGIVVGEKPDLLPLVFDAYENGRVHDTKLRQQLLDIEEGCFRFKIEEDGSVQPVRYGLADLAFRHLGVKVSKGEDTYRLRYGELDEVPLEDWPKEAKEYALLDAKLTRDVFFKQRGGKKVTDEAAQCKASFALQLCSIWGLRTDGESVATLKTRLEAEKETLMAKLSSTGIYRADGTRDVKALRAYVLKAFEVQNLPPPETPKGEISTATDTLRMSGDEMLAELADGNGVFKLLSSFVPVLEAGTKIPVLSSYECLVASGRTSARAPYKPKKAKKGAPPAMPAGFNVQQMPRKGGVRECFISRLGYVFSSVDWGVAELRALAQICLWLFKESKLAEAFMRGEDPHLRFASQLLDLPYEEVFTRRKEQEIKDARQYGKVVNFGAPGGLSASTLCEYARTNYGMRMERKQGETLHKQFFQTWPEVTEYFRWVKLQVGYAEGPITQFVSGRIRGACGFTDGANTTFQGLVADMAKEAVWRIQKECYVQRDSPLFGSRMVAFVHDETILEVPEDKAHEAAQRQAHIMREVMQQYLPDIPPAAEPALMRRWYKDAEAVYVDGKLVVWEPPPKVATKTAA